MSDTDGVIVSWSSASDDSDSQDDFSIVDIPLPDKPQATELSPHVPHHDLFHRESLSGEAQNSAQSNDGLDIEFSHLSITNSISNSGGSEGSGPECEALEGPLDITVDFYFVSQYTISEAHLIIHHDKVSGSDAACCLVSSSARWQSLPHGQGKHQTLNSLEHKSEPSHLGTRGERRLEQVPGRRRDTCARYT
jgi:hypothetical protein